MCLHCWGPYLLVIAAPTQADPHIQCCLPINPREPTGNWLHQRGCTQPAGRFYTEVLWESNLTPNLGLSILSKTYSVLDSGDTTGNSSRSLLVCPLASPHVLTVGPLWGDGFYLPPLTSRHEAGVSSAQCLVHRRPAGNGHINAFIHLFLHLFNKYLWRTHGPSGHWGNSSEENRSKPPSSWGLNSGGDRQWKNYR